MPITIVCPNGHRLKASEKQAGKSLPCPACGQKIIVPSAGQTDLDADPLAMPDLSNELLSPEWTSQPQLPAASLGAPTSVATASTSKSRMSPPKFLVIAGTTGGVGFVLVLLLFVGLAIARLNAPKAIAVAPSSPAPASAPNTQQALPAQPVVLPSAVNTPAVNTPAAKTAPADSTWNKVSVHDKLGAINIAFLLHDQLYNTFTHSHGTGPLDSRLSWRVHLLPYLGEGELYSKFHLDQPWDEPHNRTLLDALPAVYRLDDNTQLCRFHVFTGPKSVFPPGRTVSMSDMPDGPTQTILLFAGGKDLAVPWTKPVDLPCETSTITNVLNSVAGGKLECVFVDGSLLSFPATESPQTLEALVTPAGREVVDVEALRKNFGPEVKKDPAQMAHYKQTMKAHYERMDRLKTVVGALNGYTGHHEGYVPIHGNDKYLEPPLGRAKLSWRVHLLQFLDQKPLYDRFKLDEPWDSPNNKPLLDEMPAIFRDVADPPNSNTTRIMTFSGPDTPFATGEGINVSNMPDGRGTLFAFLSGVDKAVPWTKPVDAEFDPADPWKCVGTPYGPGWYMVTFDGAVRYIKTTMPAETLKVLVTPAGREKLPNGITNFGYRFF